MEITLLLALLLLAGLFWTTAKRIHFNIMNCIGAVMLLAMAILTTYKVSVSGPIHFSMLDNLFYIDEFSVVVLDTILIVSALVCIYAIGYMNHELNHQSVSLNQIRLFYSLTYVFIFTMILVVTTQNLGVMWIAIEATTLASAFLVGFYNSKESIEAAWKYVIICSVGIALALLGIVLLYISAVNVFEGSHSNLNWSFLLENAKRLHSSILKIAFIFILVGFGTKVGLAPMHTWLPDAHSQAPAPISALLSGVLLNSAMYGIIRVLTIVNKNLGNTLYTGRLLIGAGLISITAAAIFILVQKDYKRMLAYSSIEHMGIITFGLGIFTPAAIFASLFHMLNHAFTKSLLFLASGNIYLKYKTREISKVSGIFKMMPVTGVFFLLGLFAIAGMPPFSIFASELNLITAGFAARHPWLASYLVLLIAVVFAGIASIALKMFYSTGLPPRDRDAMKPGEVNFSGIAVMGVLLFLICAGGLYLPSVIKDLLVSAVGIVKGGH